MKVLIPPEAAGERISDYLKSHGYLLAQPCGGKGTCGKCLVTLEDGTTVRACKTLVPAGGVTVTFTPSEGAGLTVSAEKAESLPEKRALALDIGTTTLALAAVDQAAGRVFATRSCLNPQSAFGADVITRIGQANEHLAEMQAVLLNAVKKLAEDFLPIETMTVVGNPTMLALFCGVSPEPMGHAPFTPAFTDRLTLTGESLGLPLKTVHVLPGASAFVGADVLAGIAHTDMTASAAPVVLMDIGTNGEMAVFEPKTNTLTVTSAAAGPALEGANISCGIGGIKGAVSKVWTENGKFYYETVGDAPAVGLCGSGLIDLTACLLNEGYLDETGALEDDPFVLEGIHRVNGRDLPDEGPVLSLTQKDIRELQLAKSAVRAGLDTLLSVAGVAEKDVARLYLAGGMGFYLNGISAARIGLLPERLLPVLSAVGNSALAGAIDALKDPALWDADAARAKTVELNGIPAFADRFIENMMFPEEE